MNMERENLSPLETQKNREYENRRINQNAFNNLPRTISNAIKKYLPGSLKQDVGLNEKIWRKKLLYAGIGIFVGGVGGHGYAIWRGFSGEMYLRHLYSGFKYTLTFQKKKKKKIQTTILVSFPFFVYAFLRNRAKKKNSENTQFRNLKK